MPPIKGRMMGRMGGPSGLVQPNLDFRSVKNIGIPRKKGKFNHGKPSTPTSGDPQLVNKLRIPRAICKSLPSMKKFQGQDYDVDVDSGNSQSSTEDVAKNQILGLRKGKGADNKYHIKALLEKRFNGIVWDLAFSPNPTEFCLAVACGSAILLCDRELNKVKELPRIRLAGGVAFFSDGRIVSMCRFMDVVNIYSPTGDFLREFSSGPCPMTLAVNSQDEILVSDCTKKEVVLYDDKGRVLRTVESTGRNYRLKWPLYMAMFDNDSFAVADCHQQLVLVFDEQGDYKKMLPLKTHGGNEVLRPHGICLTQQQDLFVIDSAVDSIDVFDKNGAFLQNLLPSEEGTKLRPKILACSRSDDPDAPPLLAVGGLKGQVRLFQFVNADEAKMELQDLSFKKESSPDCLILEPKVKRKVKPQVKIVTEVKSEVKMEDDVTVIVLD